MTAAVRVLQVVRPAQGGIRTHVLTLLDGLDPALITCAVAAPTDFSGEARRHPLVAATIPLDIAPRLSLARDLLAARRLAHAIPQFADVVHAHGARAAWICALAHRQCPFPLLFTAHNLVAPDLAGRLGLSFIGRHLHRAIAVSPSVASSLAACGLSRAKIQVIPNGVDLTRFVPVLPAAREEARLSLGVLESDFVIAAAARLSPEKGIDTLLAAAGQRKTAIFLIAGCGPEQTTLMRSCPPNVRLLGRVRDVRSLLAAADVFAVPSRLEGQGIAALEAMASGVPLVASSVGGLADMLTDGKTALLVPPNDPEAFAAALGRLQSDPRLCRQLAQNALGLVRKTYSLEPMLDALTAAYLETRSG